MGAQYKWCVENWFGGPGGLRLMQKTNKIRGNYVGGS